MKLSDNPLMQADPERFSRLDIWSFDGRHYRGVMEDGDTLIEIPTNLDEATASLKSMLADLESDPKVSVWDIKHVREKLLALPLQFSDSGQRR